MISRCGIPKAQFDEVEKGSLSVKNFSVTLSFEGQTESKI
jgi:hypothetical protein